MTSGPGGRRGAVFAEINMIPLIDVALILLIIFMVLTPALVQSHLSVKLPKSSEGETSQQGKTVEVGIEKGGAVSINGRRVAKERLEHELTLVLSRSSQKTVLVQADRDVPVQSVVEVLDISKRLGVGKLGIGVAQSK